MKQFFKQYGMYLIRWQMSTLILWPCVQFLPYSALIKTIISNLIGGLIFFWIDRIIFNQGGKTWQSKSSPGDASFVVRLNEPNSLLSAMKQRAFITRTQRTASCARKEPSGME